MIKVSILVPTYGAEDFIEECLDSLINQTLKEIEIICINDGSPDKSLDIIKRYAKQDKRIKIIDKKNTGYGDSMNKGLAAAKGEYIGIVEPDDFIELDAFETLYNIAKKEGAEVVKSNFFEYYGEIKKDKNVTDMFGKKEIGKIIDPRKNKSIFYLPPSIWAAIYKRSFLEKNKINFLPTPGASFQDTGFNFKVWASARRVFFVKQAFLHYRSDNSNSSVKDSKKVDCVQTEYESIEKFLSDNGLLEELGPTMFTAKTGGFIWNLHRLKFGVALEFAKTVKSEYKRAEKMGWLAQLDDVGKYNTKLTAIKHPTMYVILRPIHSARNRIRDFFRKIAHQSRKS